MSGRTFEQYVQEAREALARKAEARARQLELAAQVVRSGGDLKLWGQEIGLDPNDVRALRKSLGA